MRVISGAHKGRILQAPKGHRTHPMGDRIKSALFNYLHTEVIDARVLDAYGGSGALAIEALSRGAAYAQVVEKDKKAVNVIEQNFSKLDINTVSYKLTWANVASWSDNNENQLFSLIFVDPPFGELNLSTVKKLIRHLTPNGLMVLSHVGREAVPTAMNGVVVVDNRMYGNAALSYYRKAG